MEALVPLISKMLVIATVLAVITLALTQVVIASFDLSKRKKPIISLGIGLLLGVATMTIVEIPLPTALWVGGISGLVASGAYDSAKAALEKVQKKDDEGDTKDE